jgi:hypothetical protein
VNCQEIRENAAADLLTGQPLGQYAEEHLSTCSDCRREVEQLQSMVSLLELAPPAATTESPGDLLLHRTLARASQERRRRRIVAAVGVAAALLIALPAVAWTIASDGGPDVTASTPSPTVLRTTATDPTTGIKGSAQLQPSVAGSELSVAVTGVKSGTECSLVMVDRAGERTVVDTWTADYGGQADVATQISVPVSQVSHVQLVDSSAHDVLLHFNFT